jgi:hypothetical protein
MEHVSALPPESWPALIGAFNDLAAQRHLQAFFNNDAAQQEIERFGWSGELNPARSADYMIEVESNYGGTKANYYLERHFTVTLTRRGAVLHHQVAVDLVNDTPYGSYPAGVYYRPYLRLYVAQPASTASDNLRPVRYRSPDPPSGILLLDGWLSDIQCCGAQARAVFEYDTPWSPSSRGIHRIYWQKQPGTAGDTNTAGDKLDVIWDPGSGHSYRQSGDLGKDRVITLMPVGVMITAGQPAQATLPSLSLG